MLEKQTRRNYWLSKFSFGGKKMEKRVFVVSAVIIAMLAISPAPAVIIDSINADKTPSGVQLWEMGEIGWLYTPQFSYTLTGIQSLFGGGGGPAYPLGTVTLEIYDGFPIDDSALLRSATFAVENGIPGGGTFAPLEISAGSDYFVGFRSYPAGGGTIVICNFALDGVSLPCYYGTDNTGQYLNFTTSPYLVHPILMFEGVPEPATLLLLGLGGLMLHRRR
jgi:hypothetical protein